MAAAHKSPKQRAHPSGEKPHFTIGPQPRHFFPPNREYRVLKYDVIKQDILLLARNEHFGANCL